MGNIGRVGKFPISIMNANCTICGNIGGVGKFPISACIYGRCHCEGAVQIVKDSLEFLKNTLTRRELPWPSQALKLQN